ncbi:hypothetical protein M378DRAFT_18589 [Amanita muscaria Koide BX008]|uniref:Uncharacterized protein n=1 Tax=Amanita muscaria (strain Koide BX008) TaxID=946122 RepID=A0A0C2WF58_AMAMK|nr:hypothetical protein M378DRAFT_18589 [Amanita muscaria Koide BX008]
MDYVQKCIEIVEHGNPLFGIDSPTTIPHNWFIAPPHVVELQGGFYELSPGNAKTSHPDLKRDYLMKECLICGRDHFTNEHESQIILIEKDLQESSLDSRFNPRRTSLFTGPGEPIHVQYYYLDVFYATEDGQQIEGRVIPSPTIPQQGRPIRSFDLPSRPSTSTRVAAEEIRITRPRGTSVQAQRMRQASYEAIDRTIPRGVTIIPPSIPTGVNTLIRLPTTTERPQHSRRVSTVPPTPGPSRTTRQTGPPP